jgi:hypothetical protein
MWHGISVSLVVAWFSVIAAPAQDTGRNPSASRKTMTVTVTGCLTEGPQPKTFLLARVPDPLVDPLVIGVVGGVPTVTYQLTGGKDGNEAS